MAMQVQRAMRFLGARGRGGVVRLLPAFTENWSWASSLPIRVTAAMQQMLRKCEECVELQDLLHKMQIDSHYVLQTYGISFVTLCNFLWTRCAVVIAAPAIRAADGIVLPSSRISATCSRNTSSSYGCACPMALVEVNSSLASGKATKVDRKATLRRLMGYAAPEALLLSCGFAALTVNSITNLTFPIIIGNMLDSAGTESLQSFLVKSGGYFLVGSVASWIRTLCLGTATENIVKRIRADLFDSLLNQDMEYYERSQTGDVITLLEEDTTTAASVFTEKLASVLRSLNSSVNGSFALYRVSPKLAAVSLSVVPIAGVGSMALMRYSRRLANELRTIHAKILSYGLERVRCISTVRLNHREEYEKNQFNELQRSTDAISVSKYSVEGLFMSFLSLSANLSLTAMLRVGGTLIASGEISNGALMSFLLQTGFVGLGFSGLGTSISDMFKSIDAVDRVFKVIDMKKREEDAVAATALTPVPTPSLSPLPSSTDLSRRSGSTIHLEDVSYSYPNRPEVTVLSGVTLDILPGQITVFVGKSGAGKSTLAALLCGLYTPTAGQISYGITLLASSSSHDLPADSRAVFYDLCGVMEQSTNNILSGTIYENIAYGKLDATAEEVIAAAKAANAHGFIEGFPKKYDTQVGSTGCMLSGGQRARIALARALIRRPQYVVLDEPTSSLDHDSENDILSPLQALRETTSVIIFTHSDTLMGIADRLYSVEDGHVRLVR